MPPKKKQNTLGRSIIKSRFQGQLRPQTNDTRLFVPDFGEEGANMNSITQENDLDAFLRTAEMAGTEFRAERLNVQVIMPDTGNPYLLSADGEREMLKKMDKHSDRLTIPRRPDWDETTTPEELKRMENLSFLEWRRGLAELEEEYEMILTPYERNLEVWRQLWRVVERSHVVVQIVDARNPLFFRSKDLESYVKEVDGSKLNVLLINKADYLSEKQRRMWAEYLNQEPNIRYAFFSAVQETEDDGEMQSSIEDLRLDASYDKTQVLNPRQLISFFNTFHTEDRERTLIGLVGYPNVGKSSTINKLLGEKRVTVSSTPGKTKHFQTMILSDIITLCDCPGLVFPSFATTKAEMVVNGVLPIDQLREFTAPSHLVAERIPRFFLEWIYGITLPLPKEGEDPNRPPTGSELLIAYAIVRGFRKAGQGNPDESRSARVILKDYVNGKLLFSEAPPGIDSKEYNSDTYSPGGKKYKEAEQAKERLLLMKEKNLEVREEVPVLMEEKPVEARIKGKSGTFSRVTSFPHQSGYSLDDGSGGKKSHKNGKRRVKDRSWRVKD